MILILILPIDIYLIFNITQTFYLILCVSMKILPYYNTIFQPFHCSAAVGQYVDPNQSFLLSYSNHLPRTLVPSVDLKKKLYIYTRFFALNVLRYNRFVNKKWQYIYSFLFLNVEAQKYILTHKEKGRLATIRKKIPCPNFLRFISW